MRHLPTALVERLLDLRGWTPEAIERLGLGYDGERVLFPVREATGVRLGFTRYQPNGDRRSEREPKMRADSGMSRELFPPPEMIGEDEHGGLLWLVEGEPDAVRLWSLGLPAVGVPGTQGWRDERAARFSGPGWRVVVCFDCDEGGRASALRVARALVEAGVDARVLDLDPGRADGFDLSDFVASARSEAEREQARQLLADCAERALAPVVLAARGLGALLDDVVVFCRRFLATLADAHFDLLALWAAHTYVMDAAETTPYLHGTSAEILSGKTRMLEVLDLLVQKPAPILDPSAAALYRGLASKEVVTLLIDEVDNFLPGGKADSDAKKTILGILNGGYRRGMRVPRVTDGRNLEWFEPFGPKALTGLRGLPQTLASRSLRFEMRRRRRDEPVERFRRRRALADAEPLAGRLAAWASAETIAALAQADPALPAELDDRQMDACEILVAIADLAAGTWPKRARDALVTITREAGEVDAAESYGTQLLADMRDAFDEFDDRVATLDLLARLNALDERAWGSWHDGAGIDARALARVLRRFGIRPVTVRLADDTTAKGYRRDACEDAFARYLPPQSVTSVTTAQPCGSEAARDPSQDGACDGYAMAATPHGSGDVTDVTDLGHGKPPEEAAQRHEPPGPARTDDDRNEPGPEQMQFGADEAPAA